MNDVLKNLKEQSPTVVVLMVSVFLGKNFIEGKITSVNKRIDQVSAASLRVKTDLRSVEREALVEFRQALTAWEHHLFKGPSMLLSDDVSVKTIDEFYAVADERELAVKMAWSKLGVVASDAEVDGKVLESMVTVRETLFPPMNNITNEAIDLRADLDSIEARLQPVYEAEKKGPLSPEMQKQGQDLVELAKKANARKVELMREASAMQVKLYPALKTTINELKDKSRALVYRKLTSDQIGED